MLAEQTHADLVCGVDELRSEVRSDNPFVNKLGARPEVYAYGLRDQLGIAYHTASGQILAVDNGPNGGDEFIACLIAS